jgi:tetratricopeptide (TPR) repeat protein
MRCLSVQQPFARMLCVGLKTVENRDWETEYRGLVAIHAGLKKQQVNKLAREVGKKKIPPGLFSFGAIIGVAELVDIVEMNESLESNPLAFGPACWLFKNPFLLPSPVPSKGKLQLYALSEEESEQVRRQLPGSRAGVQPADAGEWVAAMIRPDPVGDCVQRALAYSRLGRDADAIRNCDKAIQIDPDSDDAFYVRALTKIYLQKDYSGGVRDCTKVIQLKPRDARAFMMRSRAHRELGNLSQAEADYQKAVAVDPGIAASMR